MSNRKKIIISCGGTGGHIFPGIEIANAIKAIDSSLDILFVGAKNKMEMSEVPKAGFPIKGLWIQGFNRTKPSKNILLPIKLFHSIIYSIFLLYFHRPIAVIGTGGFASGPILFSSAMLGFSTYIQEQNFTPGFTNKLLSYLVKKVFVAYDGMNKFFPDKKIYKQGNPVRQTLKQTSKSKSDAKLFFNLKNNYTTVLVMGGSLGAEPINCVIQDNIKVLLNNNIQLIWQTGKVHHKKYQHLQSDNCSLYKFIHNMDLAYLAADIVISRAGAIAISEICFLEKASIIIPSPHVTANHQYYNAKYLENHGACIMIEEYNLDKLLIDSIFILKVGENRKTISKKANMLFNYNAASKISNIIIKDIK